MKENSEVNEPKREPAGDVEAMILAVLASGYAAGQIIDVGSVQKKCQAMGIPIQRFSYGFVRLLMNGKVQPRGEFTYVLASGMPAADIYSFAGMAKLPGDMWQQPAVEDPAL